MILLHHPEVELSRDLLAQLPEGAEVIEGAGEYAVSAFPSVVVDVPTYTEDRPAFGPDGEFMGMETAIIEAHQELLRMPASWDAVESFLAFVEVRAAANPPV